MSLNNLRVIIFEKSYTILENKKMMRNEFSLTCIFFLKKLIKEF